MQTIALFLLPRFVRWLKRNKVVGVNRAVTFSDLRSPVWIIAMAQSSDAPLDPNYPPVFEDPLPFPKRETFSEKLPRKIRENPFVPLGCLVTAGILSYGLFCFYKGNTRRSQLMMRARVISQGLTLGAILMGMMVTGVKAKKQKELQGRTNV